MLLAFLFLFFLGEWGPALGISLARPIFHLKDPGYILKKILYVFLANSTPNCSTEIGEQSILFFLGFVEESSKRAAQIIASHCRQHVGGYTAVVCV